MFFSFDDIGMNHSSNYYFFNLINNSWFFSLYLLFTLSLNNEWKYILQLKTFLRHHFRQILLIFLVKKMNRLRAETTRLFHLCGRSFRLNGVSGLEKPFEKKNNFALFVAIDVPVSCCFLRCDRCWETCAKIISLQILLKVFKNLNLIK